MQFGLIMQFKKRFLSTIVLVFCCYITNYYKFAGLKQYALITGWLPGGWHPCEHPLRVKLSVGPAVISSGRHCPPLTSLAIGRIQPLAAPGACLLFFDTLPSLRQPSSQSVGRRASLALDLEFQEGQSFLSGINSRAGHARIITLL